MIKKNLSCAGMSGVWIKRSLLAAGFASLVSSSAWAGQLPDAVAGDGSPHAETGQELDLESAAHAKWSAFMARSPSPDEGCFHASYPSIVWQRVPCKIGRPRVHPTHVQPSGDPAVKITESN